MTNLIFYINIFIKKNHSFIIVFFIAFISGCTEGESFWSKPVGSSVFAGILGSDEKKEEKEEEKSRPLITYDALSDNISGDLTKDFTNPMHKIPVGGKLVDGFTSGLPAVKLEPVIKGNAKVAYDNLQGPFPPDFSGIIPSTDGGDFPPPIPDLPFADLNKSPMITHPFTSIENIAKAPPTEFFFDEVSKRPPVLED